jgi:hypothetical protein
MREMRYLKGERYGDQTRHGGAADGVAADTMQRPALTATLHRGR